MREIFELARILPQLRIIAEYIGSEPTEEQVEQAGKEIGIKHIRPELEAIAVAVVRAQRMKDDERTT